MVFGEISSSAILFQTISPGYSLGLKTVWSKYVETIIAFLAACMNSWEGIVCAKGFLTVIWMSMTMANRWNKNGLLYWSAFGWAIVIAVRWWGCFWLLIGWVTTMWGWALRGVVTGGWLWGICRWIARRSGGCCYYCCCCFLSFIIVVAAAYNHNNPSPYH